jgi:hypothetical protein
MWGKRKLSAGFFGLAVMSAVAACGLYTPDKDPFSSDAPLLPHTDTRQGIYEDAIVQHVTCEISQGLVAAQQLKVPFLSKWGTTVTITITVEDQTGLAPGISLFPFPSLGNVSTPQPFSLSIGGSASVNALRTETIQFTIKNETLIFTHPCDHPLTLSGVLIDGDLKIKEFIYDKAFVIHQGNGLWENYIPYNTWTEEITFVSSYGGNVTPTWKLARVSANTSSNLVTALRTNTNDLIITLGPLDACQQTKPPKGCPPVVAGFPIQLTSAAMNQHNARVQANAIAVSITGQTH